MLYSYSDKKRIPLRQCGILIRKPITTRSKGLLLANIDYNINLGTHNLRLVTKLE
jgi:hypothetical protein